MISPEETFAGLNTFYYVLITKRDCYEFFERYIKPRIFVTSMESDLC